jgi:hypothetical protein
LRKFFVATLAIAALAAFAGTCTIQHISLTTIGSNDTFAGEVHNDSGVNILQHNVIVAFLNSSGSVLETKTVQPCLRTLPTGGVNYFSAQSSFAASSTTVGLARINFDSTFKVGSAAIGAGTITNLTVNRGTTTLVVGGTFKNTDSTTLEAPNACAVVYDNAGNVIVVGLDQTMSDLATNASDTFSMTLTVPDSTTTVDHVNVYVDGLKNGVPTLPVATDLSNTVNLTPTATATALGTPGAAVKLAFLTTIPTGTHDASFGSVQVAIQDANGVTVTSSSASVTLAIASGTGSSGAVLACTTSTLTIAAVNGVATFTPCNIDRGGVAYRLTASSGGLSTGTSNSFNVNAGAVTALAFTSGPASGTSGATQNISVTQTDADGVNVWNDTTALVLSISNNAGPGGVLSCTSGLSVIPSNGIATFTGCSITKAGTGYTLKVTKASPALTQDSGSFDQYAKLVFTTQPSASAASGVDFAQQPVVKLENGDGSVISDSTHTVTLASSGGTLACTTNPVTLVAGVATFAGCDITTAGTYHLTASTNNPGTVNVDSSNITIT